MNNRDLIDLCFRNLLRRRTRTLLAVIGVVVGTCAIVVMLSIGFGLSASYQSQIESYGNLHIINVNGAGSGGGGVMISGNGGMATMGGGGGGSSTDKDKGVINERTLKKMGEIKGISAVTPVVSEFLTIAVGKKVANAEIIGIKAEALEKFKYKVAEGRMVKASDEMGMLFGSQVPNWFRDPKKNNDWGGQPIKVLGEKLLITGDMEYGQKKPQNGTEDKNKVDYPMFKAKAVGILENPSDDSAYSVYMNIENVEKIIAANKKARKESVIQSRAKTYNRAMVYVDDINDVETVTKALREDMGFQTQSPSDWLNSMKETANMIQMILGGIGGISLLVAALGITNTMIMSIYERTKEIGVMKVIGANLKDIRRMFLIEAGLIGFLGGLAGLAISYLLSYLMNTVLIDFIGSIMSSMGGMGGSAVSIIPWYVSVGALAFSTTIGVVAGYYPARRAMHLSALESLRNE